MRVKGVGPSERLEPRASIVRASGAASPPPPRSNSHTMGVGVERIERIEIGCVSPELRAPYGS